MDLNDFLIFTRVVDCGSLTAAGRELNMPKSTISRRITQLEERLAVRLLDRTTRHLKLTEIGERYYGHCQRILREIEEAEASLSDLQQKPQGRLNISTPVEFGMYYMGGLVSSFMDKYPEIQCRVDLSGRATDLLEDDIDIALKIGDLPDSNFVATRLGVLSRGIYASPEYIEKHGPLDTHEQLLESNCIVMQQSQHLPWGIVDPQGIPVQARVKGSLVANNITFIRDAVIGGLGIGLLPVDITAKAVQEGKLISVLENYTVPPSTLHAVYLSRRYVPPKITAFINHLKENLAMAAFEAIENIT